MNLITSPKKTKVLLLVDNRIPSQEKPKNDLPNLRSSAFMDTEIDPLESRVEVDEQSLENQLIMKLQKKVDELEKRVKRLESASNQESMQNGDGLEQGRKKRRKFAELERDFKCLHDNCARVYNSETSLKYHLKLKHSSK